MAPKKKGRVSELLRAAAHSTVRVIDALHSTRFGRYFFKASVAALVAASYVSTTAAIVLQPTVTALFCWSIVACLWAPR